MPRLLLTAVGWLEFVASCLLWGLLLVPIARLLSLFTSRARDWFGALTRSGLRLDIASMGFFRLRVEGTDRRLSGPRIVVANHQSWLDPIVLLGREPGPVGPARSDMFRVPLFSWVLDAMGVIPADMGEPGAFARIRVWAATARDRGDALLFFPEGTRTRTGDVGAFQRGAFRVAVDLNLPLQLVVIDGLNKVLPPGVLAAQARGRPVVRVRYLAPLCPPYGQSERRQVVRDLAERSRERIVEALGAMRAANRDE